MDPEPAPAGYASWRRVAIGASIGFLLLLAYVVRGLVVAPAAGGMAWGADLEQIWGAVVGGPQPLRHHLWQRLRGSADRVESGDEAANKHWRGIGND